ncbi:hypothetical protein GOP47_0008899 [Adiantum capillus-veneris]|uniref:Pentatricopeptide repeat-containing protein n=1 Tax=Adiantum capillus-veneris TaxID=13818 RepID=A0A9D4UZG1_ADICA|nr:hypothetical protein GOP47_0008899 [Adiantum capillus-veneris]
MRAKCGLSQASWNCMLSIAVKQGHPYKVLLLFRQMQQEGVPADSKTCVLALQACCTLADSEGLLPSDRHLPFVDAFQVGMALHSDVRCKGLSSHPFVGSVLVNLYGKCGHVAAAENVFFQMTTHDVVSWTTLLAVYVEHSHGQTALHMFKLMLEHGIAPNDWTFSIMIQACCTLMEQEEPSFNYGISSRTLSLEIARALHDDILRSGHTSVYVSSALVTVYAMFGDLAEAECVFCKMYHRDVVSWNAMLSAYVEQEEAEKALLLYSKMHEEATVRPNNITFVVACQACSILAEKQQAAFVEGVVVKETPLKVGRALHVDAKLHGVHCDPFVGSVLVDMYSKCGSILESETVFDGLFYKNTATWNAMLSAYVGGDQVEKGLLLYERMVDVGVSFNSITFKCVLGVSSETGCLETCQQTHFTIVSGGTADTSLSTTLIHAYGNCASMEDAKATFSTLCHSDVVSWNALCAGHAREGSIIASMQTFDEMQQADIEPDDVSFLSLMSVCNHAGLVSVGMMFLLRSQDKFVNPKYFASVVDLLGRAGDFSRIHMCSKWGEQLDIAALLCLLRASQTHGNVSLGKWIFNHVRLSHCQEASAYVLMSNIYADAVMWVEACQWGKN